MESDEESVIKKIIKYEKRKLKYYFAQIECNSVEAAKTLYKLCDGIKLENSENRLEILFMPKDKDYSARKFRDKANFVPADYKSPQFSLSASSHSKVKFTWDLTDPKRNLLFQRTVKEGDELRLEDYADYLGSTDSEDKDGSDFVVSNSDSEGEKVYLKKKKRKKYGAVLAEIEREREEEEEDICIQFKSQLDGESKREKLEEVDKKEKKKEI